MSQIIQQSKSYFFQIQPQVAVTNHYSPVPATSSECVEKRPIDFLPNEIESYSCENVSFSMQFGESEQGRIVCTKARLRFLPLVVKQRDLPQRSRFFDDFYDVPLCAIAKIEVAMVKTKGKPDKFVRMEYNLSSMETVSMIRLILKDMRVVNVDLRRSQNGTALANQILFFSKTGPIEKMVQCGAAMEERGQRAKIAYNGSDAWNAELQRCHQKTDSSAAWTVCALHKEGFSHAAQGYPMYVVLSNYLSRTDIERQLQNYKQGRFPIWVWSRSNGNASLLVSSDHENNVATPEILAKMQDSIARCHPASERPHIMKLSSDFVIHVGKSFDHLLSLCAIEEDGRDLSIVVASLTQICCDPFYRTTTGFQQLIDKMWIALGHPFGERLVGRDDDAAKRVKPPTRTPSAQTDVAPTWLLFLDCVAQLHRIYSFELVLTAAAVI
uniref:Myotubularin phosphatase domain-containing protein n=2 Tax=Caenorhabditis japonica TaxID=281687 RepID=A0A8R1HGT9_CAEJA